jgi:hypothetical protein
MTAMKPALAAMKKSALLLGLACALSIAPDGQAELAITNTQALGFGKFVAGSGGTITIDTNGARSASGGVALIISAGGTAATFNITESNPDVSNAYIVELPPNGTVTLSSGSNSMAIDNFVSNPSGLLSGTQTLSVGATLTIGPNQPVGSYSGSFSVTVVYQ